MQFTIKTYSISILIVILFELFTFNLSLPIDLVQSISAKSSHMERTSNERPSPIVLPDRNLSPLMVTNDASPKSEKDIFFMKNSNSSSIPGTDSSSFMTRDIQGRSGAILGSSSTSSSSMSAYNDNIVNKTNPYEVAEARNETAQRKQKKKMKAPPPNFLFKKSRKKFWSTDTEV